MNTRTRRAAPTAVRPAAQGSEEDVRLRMLNSFMSCPHRDTDAVMKIHKELRDQDPVFYAHLACWYQENGDVRDHKEVFAGMLVADSYQPNREVGLALFREQAPFMKARILGFVRGKEVKIRVKTGQKKRIGKKLVDDVRIEKKKVGLEVNTPNSFRTDVARYLQWLEADSKRFDSVAFKNAADLKALYYVSGKHALKHGERAQKVLWERDYPKDSPLNVFKQVTDAKTPEEAAKLIVENKIPYTVAVGLVSKVTPVIWVALINAMSPKEVVNNIASLEEHGIMDNPDLKKLVEKKLEGAKKAKSMDALKSKTAKSTNRVKDESVLKKLDEIADVQVKKAGVIKVPTAIFVDKSGSMTAAIETGKRAAALVSGVSMADLHVLAFDTMARRITATDKTLTAWENAFKPVRANGGTSIGVALDLLLREKLVVDQIVVITDEDENTAPFFYDVYERYATTMNVRPRVIVINVQDEGRGACHKFSDSLKSAKIDYEVYKPEKFDYYGLPGLTLLLSRNSKLDLLYEIMAVPLKVRQPFKV